MPDGGTLMSRLVKLGTLFVAAFLLAASTRAELIDPNSPEGYVKLNRKVQCSLNDGEETVFRWTGRLYSKVFGEPDRHLFNVEGMNVRACVTVKDPKMGDGYRMVSREIMLYLDPETNEILDTWENPWTGQTNEVIHVHNDPVNSRGASFGYNRDGSPKKFEHININGTYMLNMEIPLFYHNPMGGNYQKYIGGTYHATEIFDFNGSLDTLLDASRDIEYPVVSWVRMSKWLPWMEMGDRIGLLWVNAMGKKLDSYEQLPDVLKDTIAERFPEYQHAPPLDDTRRNETTWTKTKLILDSRKQTEPKAGGH